MPLGPGVCVCVGVGYMATEGKLSLKRLVTRIQIFLTKMEKIKIAFVSYMYSIRKKYLKDAAEDKQQKLSNSFLRFRSR